MKDDINCFECKHADWDYYDDVPIVKYLYCMKNHKNTSYNTAYDDKFTCDDYRHSYFCKAYYRMWFTIIMIALLIIFALLCYYG